MGSLMNTVHQSSAVEADDYPIGPFELPGFVENGTTYESFSFVVRFKAPKPHRPLTTDDNPVPRYRQAHLTETNGAGTFHYRLKGAIVDAIYALANEDRRLCFHVVQCLRYAHTESFNEGRADGIHFVGRAAAQGRLKVRKVRGREAAKVWVTHLHTPRYAEWDATYETTPPEACEDGVIELGWLHVAEAKS